MANRNVIIGAAVAALVIIYGASTATYVPEGQEGKLTGEVSFDPNQVVTEFWQKNSKSYFSEKATDLSKVISESGGDFKSVAAKYGRYSMGDSGELSFVVKGQGTVTEVKDKLRSGYLVIKPDDVSDDYKVRIQIGPVYKGSAVRDTISLINYKDYKNQIEWAQVSVALHELVQKEVVTPVKPSELLNKKVSYIGCFTVGTSPKTLNITPVELKVVE